MKLCLVDSRVNSSIFMENVQSDVTSILIDYENDVVPL